MNRIKRLIFNLIIIISFNYNHAYSQNILDLNKKTYLDFYILESNFDPGNFISGNIHKLGYKPYNWNKTPLNRPVNNRMISFRAQFTVDSTLLNNTLFLAVLISDYPYNLYLNGHLISDFGDYSKSYTSRKLYSSSILLPNDFVIYHNDSVNELALQLYPQEGEIASFSQPFIASSEVVKTYVFWKNFWGYSLVKTISFFCLMISFYFFLIFFLSNPSFVNHNLYYALFNVFVAISYINNVFNYDFAHTFLLEKTVRTAFILQGASLTGFFLIYTGYPKKKTILLVVNSIAIIITVIALIQPDLRSVNLIWSRVTSPFLLSLNIFVIIITGRYLFKTKTLAAYLFFFTYLAHIFAAGHDIYYFVFLQVRPYVLFTPFLIFIVSLVVFLVLAKEQTQTYILTLKQAKKLKKFNEDLEIEVNNRTSQLTESVEELNNEIDHHKQTQVQLQEINATKDKFFSIIAHDLKTPFNALLGYTNLLTISVENSDLALTSQYANLIHTSSVNAFNLLENLLIWSGSQTGSLKYSPEVVDIKNSVDENIKLVINQALTKSISIVNVVDKKDVLADKYMIDTIMRNLLTNAIKFTHSGGEIKVSSIEKKDKIEICISDNGIGIEKDYVDMLFRIDTKHTTLGTMEEKGTGLGLPLCKEFIEKHRENLWVESEPGKGSKFKFTLKIANST